MLKVINIDNSRDYFYPFEKSWFDDPYVLYHGTSSNYADDIESIGWKFKEKPYDINDFVTICNIFESIKWDGTDSNSGYSVLRSFTVGGDGSYVNSKPASFSQIYWTARNYSRNLGGESIHFFFNAIEDIVTFVNDKKMINEHREILKEKLDENLEFQRIAKNGDVLNDYIKKLNFALSNLSTKFLKESEQISKKLLKKYRFKKKPYPVVFVIKAEENWFDVKTDLTVNFPLIRHLEVRSKMNIPSNSIIGRINFLNGVMYKTIPGNTPCPVPWDKENWEKWDKEHNYDGDDAF